MVSYQKDGPMGPSGNPKLIAKEIFLLSKRPKKLFLDVFYNLFIADTNIITVNNAEIFIARLFQKFLVKRKAPHSSRSYCEGIWRFNQTVSRTIMIMIGY